MSLRWQFGLMALCLFVGCEQAPPQFAAPPPPAVTVSTPTLTEIEELIEATGVTRGSESVAIRARVSGFIAARHVEAGTRVKKGDLLLTIDQRPFEAAVRRAEAEVASRTADVGISQVNRDAVKRSFDQQVATELELKRTEAALESAQAQLAVSQAALDSAKLDLSFTEIRAPINGRLGIEVVEMGELVGSSSPQPLATIIDDSVIYARYTIDEASVLDMREEMAHRRPGEDGRAEIPVRMGLGSGTDFPFLGKHLRGDNTFDAQTGTVTVEAIFDNANGAILPGLFARIQGILGSIPATLVPDVAVLADQTGRYLLVVNQQNQVERLNVVTGRVINRMRVITSPKLDPELRVIVNGLMAVQPGMTVVPSDATPAPQAN
jgi:multidrug efflux system membrane fusion protein